jgi:Tfp pilus assembly protein PilE
MKLPRVRFTVRRLMVAVAAVGLLAWGAVEVLVRTPERARAQSLINHHDIRAQIWERWADNDATLGSPRQSEYQRLAAWHRGRRRQLQRFGRSGRITSIVIMAKSNPYNARSADRSWGTLASEQSPIGWKL